MSMKIIPAIFAQKKMNGPTKVGETPKLLEIFEADLVKVTGGMRPPEDCRTDSTSMINGCCVYDDSQD